MRRSRIEEAGFLRVSEEFGLPVSEVGKIVRSFFDCVSSDARKLRLDDHKRIYSKELFDERVKARQIPYIGRLGPVYSRYLAWRRNEAKTLGQKPRSLYRRGMTQDEIEDIAEAILSGNAPPEIKRKKGYEMYDRIWLVGKNGKRQASQVIPKQ